MHTLRQLRRDQLKNNLPYQLRKITRLFIGKINPETLILNYLQTQFTPQMTKKHQRRN